jgi:hypothetical protein
MPNLLFLDAPSTVLGRNLEETESGGLQIVFKEKSERAVRFDAEDVTAGVHHVYYPVIATTAGRLRVPGPRAELVVAPQAYGIGAPQSIRIKEER